ncbi:MAG: isoleucine--tRNA ligase [Myxococcota bacterium]
MTKRVTWQPIRSAVAAKSYAEKFVKVQSKQMQRLGTLADYANPYLTMTPQYEAATLEVFASLVERKLVYRALKPVHWSIANQTALADAELEYRDRQDTSVFVHFDLVDSAKLPESLLKDGRAAAKTISLMIWTTTPWTLPANMAVAVAPRETYALCQYNDGTTERTVLVGDALYEAVFKKAGITEVTVLGTCLGHELQAAGLRYRHPFIDRQGPVVVADYVTTEDGTGLVHTAPGHGVDDYHTGLREGLDIYCPVQADGTFDKTAPVWLHGTDVWKGNDKVVAHLEQSGHLFFQHRFEHSYPHDWRSKTPTIFRATEQWFVAVDTVSQELGSSLRDLALTATKETIRFTPEWGQSRMSGMLESRPDWCISRQRSWGLPIPAFLKEGGEPLLTARSVRAVATCLREKGSDHWFRAEPQELLVGYQVADDPDAPAWLKSVGQEGLSTLSKSADIFDVWFESGSSWNAVLRERHVGYPADVYIEGSDQHRGWFQLSLLPALGVTGVPPFKALVTHGFIVDAQGKKMSKSGGNAIDVDELLNKYGADICRWWVASLNFANDIKADWNFFRIASDEYRKVRNTIRFCLGNLADFDPQQHRYVFGEADHHSLDLWALGQLHELIEHVRHAYETYQFRRIRDGVFNFCNDTMSAIYMTAIKRPTLL